MEDGVLSVGDLSSTSDTGIMEKGSKGKDLPHFILRPHIHHEVVDKCYRTDFWPKSRMDRALPGETKVGRGKLSRYFAVNFTEIDSKKIATEVMFLSFHSFSASPHPFCRASEAP